MTQKALAIGGLLAMAAGASAQLSSVGPFVGTYQETFGGLPNYMNGGAYNTLSIMGGEGTFSTAGTVYSSMPQLNVYNAAGSATFGVNGASANTVGSSNGLGLFNDGSPLDVTLTFSTAVNYFGGYFADVADVPVSVNFYDAGSNPIGGTQQVDVPNTANLSWFGWYSSTGIQSIAFTGGMATAMGDLEAGTPVLTPEPAAMAVFGLGIVGLLLRRRR